MRRIGGMLASSAAALCAMSVCAVGQGATAAATRPADMGGTPMTQNAKVAQTDLFPIVAWHSIPAAESTAQRYRELAESGINLSIPLDLKPSAALPVLEMAGAAGVRVMVPLAGVRAEDVPRAVRDHPAFWGYFVKDEPSKGDFPALAETVAALKRTDPRHPAYINLFPTYANETQLGTKDYVDHVRAFCETVRPPFLSFDHYPVRKSGLAQDCYLNLEVCAREGERRGLPLWTFALTVLHAHYTLNEGRHVRFQVYNGLAYGARAMQYFTYWTPADSSYDFHQGPIERDGRRTPVYDVIRQVNAELRVLAPTVAGLKRVGTWHAAPLPKGTQAASADSPVRAVRGGPGFVSLMRSVEGGEYLWVKSGTYEKPVAVQFELNRPARTLREVVRRQDAAPEEVPLRQGAAEVRLDPGDGRLFRLE